MTQLERMQAGLIYDPADSEIMRAQSVYGDLLWAFNQLRPSQSAEKQTYMKNTFAECGKDAYIELPFRANWGGAHLHLGDCVYVNFNLTLVDDGHIFIGSHTMIGPNVTITTANHPVNEELRRKGYQYNKDVYIGDNCWLGAGVIVLPGVHIGEGSVIGAGAVVTKDIPAHVVAYGNPCRVARPINEKDKETFFHGEAIDWENLKI